MAAVGMRRKLVTPVEERRPYDICCEVCAIPIIVMTPREGDSNGYLPTWLPTAARNMGHRYLCTQHGLTAWIEVSASQHHRGRPSTARHSVRRRRGQHEEEEKAVVQMVDERQTDNQQENLEEVHEEPKASTPKKGHRVFKAVLPCCGRSIQFRNLPEGVAMAEEKRYCGKDGMDWYATLVNNGETTSLESWRNVSTKRVPKTA